MYLTDSNTVSHPPTKGMSARLKVNGDGSGSRIAPKCRVMAVTHCKVPHGGHSSLDSKVCMLRVTLPHGGLVRGADRQAIWRRRVGNSELLTHFAQCLPFGLRHSPTVHQVERSYHTMLVTTAP